MWPRDNIYLLGTRCLISHVCSGAGAVVRMSGTCVFITFILQVITVSALPDVAERQWVGAI